ncbi:MAG: hypothetical protein J7484_01835 [Microbacterium sp.]|nr:hypothetical protein [Microbacterium sp.]
MSGILTVCDANVCRSVAAELLLRGEFAMHSALASVPVVSRGVEALQAHSACRLVAELHGDDAWQRGARAHQSRQLAPDDVETADLILTATTRVRSAVVSSLPAARRRVFTMREALWLAHGYQPSAGATGNALVQDFAAFLDAHRGLRQPPMERARLWRPAAAPFDIADGHTAGRRAHVATLAQVQDVVSGLSKLLIQDPTLPFLARKRPVNS